MDVSLDFDLLSYFYKEFSLSFSESKSVKTTFSVNENIESTDPYYDNVKNKIIVYKSSIGSNVDPFVLADIFYQITYLYAGIIFVIITHILDKISFNIENKIRIAIIEENRRRRIGAYDINQNNSDNSVVNVKNTIKTKA